MKPIWVNILGGRDVGKTTIAMHAAAELRWLGIPTSLTADSAKLWCEDATVADLRVFRRNPATLTPHEAAEMCRGALNFLVLRRKDYYDRLPVEVAPGLDMEVNNTARDGDLERTLREGHVRYKSLPGVRASVQYVVKKVCERVGYSK